jgi:hypothetical protein
MADFENILPPVGVEQGVPSSFAGSDMVFTEGVNPLPLNVPLVPYIEDVSIPAVPQGGFSVNYDQNNPFDITKQVLNSPITESDIVFEKSKVKPFQSGYQKTNFNRYYNDTDNFYKLGFDPLSNNDEIYNQNRSWYEDLGRGLLGVPALGLSVVKSSYRGMGEMLTGDFSMTDEIAADEFAQIMAERGSTKGGLTQFSSNLLLQSGFVAGIFADYLATEAVIAGSVALTEGATLPAALAASSAKTAQAARSIASMRNLFTAAGARDAYTAIRGLNATAVGRGIKAVGEAVVPRTLSNIKNTINAGDSVINYANAARGIGDFILDLKQVGYTVAEASMEGGAVKNEFIDDRINEFITNNGYYPEQEEMNKIYQLGSDAGFTTSAINTPLIYITNAITFNNLFKGKSAMLNAPTNDVIARSSLTGEKIIADTTGARILTGKEAVKTLLKPKEYLRFGAQYFKTNLSEGLQEISQEITAGASKDYYERLYETPEAGGISIYLADAFENTKKQASMQGLEVFASGFLMGGLTGIAGNLSNVSRRAGSNIYYNYIKNDPEKYNELYKAEQDRFKQIVAEFDDAIKNGNKILTLDVENLLLQARLGTDMVDARKSFDEKAFHDLKDMSRFNAIYTALEAGKFDILVQKLQDMKQMTGDELKQAFDLTDDVTADEAKQVLDVAIERAQQIKEQHKEFADYRNPFNPNRFRRTNLTDPVVKEQYVKEVINYKAFEEARKIAVFSLHGRQQAQKRMADLTDRLTEISSFGKLTFSDITPLLNINSLQQELDLLDSEIKSLTGSTDKEAIKILTSKKNKKKALELYQKNLEKAGDVSDPQVLKDKKFLREAFVKYINALSQEAGINFSKGQAEEAYSILTDYYSLNADVVQFTENLNTLYDPTSYYDLVSRLVEQQKYRRDKQTAYMEKSRKAFINAVKIRDFIQYLADGGFGIKLSSLPKDISKDYDEFISTLADDLDIVFIDFKSDREFDKSDVRYVFVLDLINKFNNIVTEPVAETTEEVTETTTEEEVVDQPALSDEIEQEEGVPLIQSVKQFNALPVKLQGLLQATLAQQNSKREADGEPELPLDRFLRTSTSRNAISKFFKDPANVADVKAYNEKKGVPKEQPPKATPTQPADVKAEIENELFSETDNKGRTYTYYSTSTEKDGRIKTTFTFNRSDKDASQRSNAVSGIPVEKALGNKYTIDEESLPEGFKVVGVVEIRITEKGAGATVTVESEGQKSQTEVKLNTNTTYNAELAALEKSKEKVKEVVVAEPVTELIDPIVEKIKNANSIQELNTLQEEFEESDLIEDLDNINAVKDAVALRKAELTKSIKYESIKAGDVLVFGDNKYGLVEKVTTSKLTVVPLYGERLTPAKDANKRITILKKDFSKMVQSVYDTQANVVIGTKNVPSPTAEENKIIEANSQNIDDFLDNEEATKKLEEQTRNKSDKDVNNDFFNNIGC